MKSPKEIGGLLREARHKKGINLDTVYKSTHIQARTIEALEEGSADTILTKVYVLLFLKKYAEFLDLDGDSLAAQYRKFYDDKKEERLKMEIPEEPLASDNRIFAWLGSEVAAASIFIIIFFILLFGIKMRLSKTDGDTAPFQGPVAIAPEPIEEKVPAPSDTQAVFPIPRGRPLEVGFRCLNDVWMKVKKDGDVVFEGTAGKNTRKSWSADDNVELWVGRAEALEFEVNGKPIGKVGSGKIKSILFTRDGLQIEGKWFLSRER